MSHAISYAARGWSVFPCKPADKVPLGRLVRHGVKQASRAVDDVIRWWTSEPDANIGIACGEVSGIVVVDLDGSDGIASWEALLDKYGPVCTPMTRTGSGGCHLLFEHPGHGKIGNSSNRIAKKIDTRSDGGYIVAPPSVHPTGALYEWVVFDVPLAPLPWWVIREYNDGAPDAPAPAPLPPPSDGEDLDGYVRASVERILGDLRGAPEGGRNHALNRAAFLLGRFVAAGMLSEMAAESELTYAGRSAGLTEHEIPRTIRSGLSAGKAHPWEARR